MGSLLVFLGIFVLEVFISRCGKKVTASRVRKGLILGAFGGQADPIQVVAVWIKGWGVDCKDEVCSLHLTSYI